MNTANHFICTGLIEDCHKCPSPQSMNEHQLHRAILQGEKEDCVQHASIIYAKRISGTLEKK